MAEDALTAEGLALLARAATAVPFKRLPALMVELTKLRMHIYRVNAACPPGADPATLFGPWR